MTATEHTLPHGKAALRAYAKALRAGMDPSERAAADRSIRMHVLALDELAHASTVFSYRSFGPEVATEGIMRALWGASDSTLRDADDAVPGDTSDAVPGDTDGGISRCSSGGVDGPSASGCVVCLPRCVPGTRELRWFRVDSLEGLERSSFGVEEPPLRAACEVEPCRTPHAVALVPGLLFDARGFRLGYGGGYYDAFLSSFPGRAIGLVRSCQLVDDLGALGALDAHDRPVDIVVTERGALRCAR